MTNKLNKSIFLAKETESNVNPSTLLALPNRILQFGTGVLLKGLPDYYVDRANKLGKFNGRIVVVKSTSAGNINELADQDYLYTHFIKGIHNGQSVDNHYINCAISEVLHAETAWQDILKHAKDPQVNIVISNTTERGIVYKPELITQNPPSSFPAKLLSYLHSRFLSLGAQDESKIVIIPTELIDNNGTALTAILKQLMVFNELGLAFNDWFDSYVIMCNSLVDRIVPGTPAEDKQNQFESNIGYKDSQLIVSEPYNLWAIQGPESLKEILTFYSCNPEIKIEESIQSYKDLKLKLLNAVHTFSAGYALMNKLQTVSIAMKDESFLSFVEELIEEIKVSFSPDIAMDIKNEYVDTVLDRFSNPNIEHFWTSIIFNYSEKFKLRCCPLIINFIEQKATLPKAMIKGLAYYFKVAIPKCNEADSYFTMIDKHKILLNDPMSKTLYQNCIQFGLEVTIAKQIREYLLTEISADHDNEILYTITEHLTAKDPKLSKYVTN